ncbi:OadG family protein [Archaeoglobus sp.]
MIDLALMLTVEGMSVVFLVLSVLALFMWTMGKLAGRGEVKEVKPVSKLKEAGFSDKEIFAIVAALMRHEGMQVVDVEPPKNWKKVARLYAMRWVE